MRNFRLSALAGILLAAAGTSVAAEPAVIATLSNTPQNSLLVYSADGQLLQSLPTHGKGGATGNAGGIALSDHLLAAVNYGSNSVSIFSVDDRHIRFEKTIAVVAQPVSVAFGNDHLYVLGAAHVESHRVWPGEVWSGADGMAALAVGDGSAAQVGALRESLIVSEKSNVIETIGLDQEGAVTGSATIAKNIPANVNAPFGLITRGNDAYVTIAHANEISLVRDGAVLTTTPSVTQQAPCWLTLTGPFLFSSNSPSMTISRYAVYGQKIVQDAAVAAQLNGTPTDIDVSGGVLAVIDGAGAKSHLSIFEVDEDGNLSLQNVETIDSAANGVVVIHDSH